MAKTVSIIGRRLLPVRPVRKITDLAPTTDCSPPHPLPLWARRTLDESTGAHLCPEDVCPLYQFFRSTRKLLSRSPVMNSPRGKQLSKLLDFVFSPDGFASKLDSGILIHFLVNFGAGPERSYVDRREAFGLRCQHEAELSDNERRLLDWLAESAVSCRRSMWQYRSAVVVEELVVERGWYPIFGTYTVDPSITDAMGLDCRDDLWTKTDAWDRFLKSVKYEVADACGLGRNSGKWPPVADWFQYFGVLEHGKSLKHPHVHVLFLCRNIPRSWKRDPNLKPFCKSRTERDITPLSALWPYGSQCMSVGVHMVGSWFTNNWLPPQEVRDGKLVECRCGNADAVAKYIGKYIQKGTKQWNHRTKCTKSLGMSGLRRSISQIQSEELLKGLAYKPLDYSQALVLESRSRCPWNLIRKLSRQELLRRWSFSRDVSDRESLRKVSTRPDSGLYTTLMNSARDSVQIWRQSREWRFNFFTQTSPEWSMDLSNEILLDIRDWLDENVGRRRRGADFVVLNSTGVCS